MASMIVSSVKMKWSSIMGVLISGGLYSGSLISWLLGSLNTDENWPWSIFAIFC